MVRFLAPVAALALVATPAFAATTPGKAPVAAATHGKKVVAAKVTKTSKVTTARDS